MAKCYRSRKTLEIKQISNTAADQLSWGSSIAAAPRSDFAPVLCTTTQAKKSLLLFLKRLIIWYYPEEQHRLLGAMLPSSASPPHTAQPSPSSTAAPEPWLPEPGLGSLLPAKQDTPALPSQARGCSEPSTALLACSWPREAAPAGIALALPSASLLRATLGLREQLQSETAFYIPNAEV